MSGFLSRLFRSEPEPAEPLTSKYSGRSGRTDLGSTTLEWAWPEWTTADLAACQKGHHKRSRKRLVAGWLSWFTQVDRYYCACGAVCWVWFDGGWAEEYVEEPGQHERWVDLHIKSEQMAEAFR